MAKQNLNPEDLTNLTNNTYGDLTVISLAFIKNRYRYWDCLCKCGKKRIVRANYLTQGIRTSCASCAKAKNNGRHYRDLTGLKFYKLYVMHVSHYNREKKEYFWRCLCDCGKEIVVNGSVLKTNRIKSCGCIKKEIFCQVDLKTIIGKRYGRLIVLENIGVIKGRRFFKCLCDCGKTSNVSYAYLRRGNTKSCGCLKKETTIKALKERRLPDFEAGFNKVFASYREKNARRRNLSFELTKEEFRKLIKDVCYYCGGEPLKSEQGYLYNGLDRVDNNKGYRLDNVVTCCYKCNIAKASMAKDEFIDWVNKVFKNLQKKKEATGG
jgi:hypothetical protein